MTRLTAARTRALAGDVGRCAPPMAAEIDRLICILDAMDADPDLEPEIDASADDEGEPPHMTFMAPPVRYAPISIRGH